MNKKEKKNHILKFYDYDMEIFFSFQFFNI